jgi:hypothetical protein
MIYSTLFAINLIIVISAFALYLKSIPHVPMPVIRAMS